MLGVGEEHIVLFLVLESLKEAQHSEFVLGVEFPFGCPCLVQESLEFVVVLSGGGAVLSHPFLLGVPELDRDIDGGLDSLSLPLVEDR